MKRMKPKVLNNGHGEVRIYQVKRNSFEVRYKVGRTRRRETRPSLEEAEDRAKKILEHFKNCQTPISAEDLQLFQYLMRKADEAGVTLLDVWKFWEDNHEAHGTEHPIGQVVMDFLRDQERRKVSNTTLRTNRTRLTPLVYSFGDGKAPMELITAKQLDEWLEVNFANLTTRKNHRTAIVQLWRWATKKGVLPDRQFTEADKTTVPMAAHKDPEVYTSEELRLMLQWMNAHFPSGLPFLALAAFSGIRNAELQRLTWGHVDLEGCAVILPAEVTKTGRRRIASIPPNVAERLKFWKKHFKPSDSSIVSVGMVERKMSDARKALGIPGKSNGLRKSYISHAVALGEKPTSKIAEECGHAEAILQTNYKGLVSQEEAQRWFVAIEQV